MAQGPILKVKTSPIIINVLVMVTWEY